MVPNPVNPDASSFSAADLQQRFEAPDPLTIGLEEEVMLLDLETLDLAPVAREVLEGLEGDTRFKPELPAAHLELMTQPHASPADAIAELAQARRDLGAAVGERIRIGAAGVHPFAAGEGVLNSGPRYDHMPAEYGYIARRQLVASLQVHVAVGGAERTLAVYNSLRSFLPEIAALAANAAWYEGRDSGMASVRPLLCALLPRQGMPPAIATWDDFAATLGWGRTAGVMPDPGFWWWELRPHVTHGTLEIRVPDAQATIEDAAGVAAFVHCLVAWLSERYDQADELPVHETWRIEENRWSAQRYGLEGQMADLETGEPISTRARIDARMEQLAPFDNDSLLRRAHALVDSPGYAPQRSAGQHGGARAVAESLAAAYI